ncbi:hypothetical protein [Deinococcus arenicola]|uniref:Lipoprotein n=1 Tax=Deinococcus arenicola TaxID=2994950 RepID=A0ABU4DM46_9DEIO|nr:hypothetical protein [Deinococcus sp. ZS9-10]MDV6373501.1 hypothetical protein [Deinococcus sp. ZS9-10]
MKKMMMAAVAIGMTGVLASCNTGSAPDGSGNGKIDSIRTEYKLNSASGRFVACDNVTNNGSRNKKTEVAINLTLEGFVESIVIGLKGNSTSQYDSNFTATATGQQLANIGSGKYRVSFEANSSTGSGLLPQSIVVTPTTQKVKIVTANNSLGSFYPQLKVKTGSSRYQIDDIAFGSVAVYGTCNVTSVTNEDI